MLAIRSDDADAVDYYYYVAGPSFDKIVAGYRRLTGAAPLFSRWAYGYCQSTLDVEAREVVPLQPGSVDWGVEVESRLTT